MLATKEGCDRKHFLWVVSIHLYIFPVPATTVTHVSILLRPFTSLRATTGSGANLQSQFSREQIIHFDHGQKAEKGMYVLVVLRWQENDKISLKCGAGASVICAWQLLVTHDSTSLFSSMREILPEATVSRDRIPVSNIFICALSIDRDATERCYLVYPS